MALTAEEQQANQEVREWARSIGGWPELSDRGRLPAAVTAAYEAWQQAQGGGGPDFAAAAAALGLEIGASPLDTDDQPPEEADADGGGSEGPPAAPGDTQSGAAAPASDGPPLPPVASLEEARARVAAAKAEPAWAQPPGGGKAPPQPGKRGRQRKPAQPPAPPEPERLEATPERLADMEGKIASLLLPPVRWWQRVDATCGGAAIEHGEDIIHAWAPVMARSQAVLRLFATDTLYFQLYAAVMATWPLIETIYDHHYSPEAAKRKLAEKGQAAAAAADEDLTLYPSTPVVSGHVPAYRPPQATM